VEDFDESTRVGLTFDHWVSNKSFESGLFVGMHRRVHDTTAEPMQYEHHPSVKHLQALSLFTTRYPKDVVKRMYYRNNIVEPLLAEPALVLRLCAHKPGWTRLAVSPWGVALHVLMIAYVACTTAYIVVVGISADAALAYTIMTRYAHNPFPPLYNDLASVLTPRLPIPQFRLYCDRPGAVGCAAGWSVQRRCERSHCALDQHRRRDGPADLRHARQERREG
jgi:hypothetical protein